MLRSRRIRFLQVLVNTTSSALGAGDAATGDMNSGILSSPGNKHELHHDTVITFLNWLISPLGFIQNCQHYKERTLFCDPLPPCQKSTLKMLILRPLLKIVMHNQRHFKQAYDDQYAVCARENYDNSGRPFKALVIHMSTTWKSNRI